MTENTRQQILASAGIYRGLGAFVEKDGITFSTAVPSQEKVSLILYRKGMQEIEAELPFPEAPYAGIVHTMKVTGINPEKYEYNFRIGDTVVTDPAARLLTGTGEFGDRSEKGEHSRRGAFIKPGFDWKEDTKALEIPYEDGILYSLHVRGFTRQKNSRVRNKGTFRGIQEKIPYFKELGINQLLLMPAYEFDEIQREKQQEGMRGQAAAPLVKTEEKLNYWGYVPGFYFAPKRSYSASDRPDVEFKTMVRTCHENGIEVLMEMAFPDPVDVRMVSDCLTWWVQEYHVDGFSLLMNQEAANVQTGNPILRKTKLLTGYFPAERIYPQGRKVPFRSLAEWNEGFRIEARRLLKGDEDRLSGFSARLKRNQKDCGVVNSITSHDGFTLMDLVSYDNKHNEENGEMGQDGAPSEYSWNCGEEGPTRKRSINRLRMKQMKNAYVMVLLAQGTPLLLSGDEIGNSQQGNSNPYCHDSELTWVDWSRERSMQELQTFVKDLIAFRKAHRILHMEKELTGSDTLSCGYPDVSIHGSKAWYADFEYQNRHMGVLYCGLYAGEEEFVYVGYNLHWENRTLALPTLPEGMGWTVRFDTALQPGEVAPDARQMELEGRSIRVLTAGWLPGAKKAREAEAEKERKKQKAQKAKTLKESV